MRVPSMQLEARRAADDEFAELAEPCQRQDREAFEELVRRSSPRIRRMLARLALRHGDVDDLVQETYLRAWRGLPAFRGESALATWLIRIAVNVWRTWRTKKSPAIALSEELGATLRSPVALSEEAVMAVYEKALGGLSPEMRAVFLLHETEGLSYRGVAETLELPMGTVMSRLHRAREHMLACLREQIGECLP